MTRNNHAPRDLADLSLRLHELAIHTGDLKHSCLGCGHEHNCGVHGCAVLLAAEDAVVKLKAYEDLGFEPKEYKMAMSTDIIVRCAAAALGVPVEQLREVVALWKAGRVVVLPSDKALTNADRMRAATNQQLAKLLYDNQKELCRMLYKKLGFEDELNFSEDYSDILAWLNAPSKEAKAALEAMKDE